MKSKLLALLLAVLLCLNVIAMAACGNGENENPKDTTNSNRETTQTQGEIGITDTEQADITTEVGNDTIAEDSDDTIAEDSDDTIAEDSDDTTSEGEETTTEAEETTTATAEGKITFKTLTVDGTNVSGVVSNATKDFSFSDEIEVLGDASYVVSIDALGMQVGASKKVRLECGDNTFYVIQTLGETTTVYTVTIHRRLMFTVTFDTLGGTAVSSQTVEEDGFVTIPTTTRTGYTFAGWSRDLTLAITEDTTVSAQWTSNPYVVTYDANGGTVTNATANVGFDLTYTLETPTKVGYTFVGWYNGTELIDLAGTWAIASDVTLKAKWTANGDTAYTVKHYIEKFDGSYELRDTDHLTGTSATQVTPATKNYPGFTAPTTQTVTVLPDGSQVVKYKYTRNSYTISFNSNGGSSVTAKTLKYEEAYTLTEPTRVGYTFAGWYNGDDVFAMSGTWTLTQNITLKAEWTANTNTAYKVEHYLEKLDGTYELRDTDNLTGISDSEVTPATKTYTGFTAPTTQTVTVLPDGSQVVKYYYTRNSYTISFNSNGGSSVTAKTLKYAEAYTLTEPTRVGYTFAGWYNGNDLIDLTGMWTIAANTTLKAKWTANTNTAYKVEHYLEKLDGTYELRDTDNLTGTSDSQVTPNVKSYIGFTSPTTQTVTVLPDGSQVVKYSYTRNSYTITFVTNGGTSINTQALKYESSLPDTERSGFTFGGWFTDIALSSSIEKVPAQNRTVYAYWSEENKPSDFTYSGTSSITITDYTASDTTVTVPSYIGGKAVTSIGYAAFRNCDSLTSVTIGNSVTGIGSYAFEDCDGLTSIEIPNSVTSIGDRAFYDCDSLTSVTIGDSVTSIGDRAFYDCDSLTSITVANDNDHYTSIDGNLYSKDETTLIQYAIGKKDTTFVIPNTVTSIGDCAFRGCSSLTSIEIPNSVTSIGNWAFSSCYSLTSVTIGNSVTSIGSYAFEGCSGLTSIAIPNSVTSIGYAAFGDCSSLNAVYITDLTAWCGITFANDSSNPLYYARNLYLNETLVTDLVIPEGVTSIGNYAFYYCSSLTSIEIPNSVTSIGSYAFEGCSGLTSIEIPNSVTSIGYAAFSGCCSLESITIPFVGATKDGTSNTLFGYIFGGSSNYSNDDYVPSSLKTVVITNATSIGEDAFSFCDSLTSIEIPNSVTSIGSSAFAWCDSLTSVTIPNSVTSIGYAAFRDCDSLTSIEIPNSVTSIFDSAFRYCDSLTSVTIGDSVTSIVSSAFSSCYSLTSITVANDNDHYTSIDGNLYSKDETTLVQYAIGKKDTTFVIPNSVTSIGSYAFEGCSGLTSIEIPNSVTSIGSYAFRNCDSLTSIEIPNSVTSIGSCAFEGCSSLTSVTIPNSVTSIGDYAFATCDNLTSIEIPNSVTSIGSSAFAWCGSLTSVTFENKQGWTAGTTAISSSDLENQETAAEYLRSTYRYSAWTRN